MNTYDDVKAIGTDRYAGLVRDVEQERLIQAITGVDSPELRPLGVHPTVQTLMLRLIRGIVGKVAQQAARP